MNLRPARTDDGHRQPGLPPDRIAAVALVVLLVALAGSGCGVVKKAARLPGQTVAAVVPGTKSTAPDPAALQVQVQRFSDDYASLTTAALDEYARRVGTPASRRQALIWKISANSSAISMATGPNPVANLLDFLAQITATRVALEQRGIGSTNGPALEPWLDSTRILETNAWNLVEGVLKPEQQRLAREAVSRWAESNTGREIGLFARPAEFTSLIRQGNEKEEASGGLLGLVGLDPTEGLQPAVQEATRARLLADRVVFMAQRMPLLLRWQVELLTDQVLGDAQIAAAVSSAERLSQAAESASATVAKLPALLTAERQAIVAELDVQQGKLRELSEAVTRALVAGDRMSTSVTMTLVTFDGLMKRFGVGEPSARSTAETGAPPFNVLDYAQAVEKVTAMAKELGDLTRELGGTLDSAPLQRKIEDLAAVSERAKADAKSVLNHAFLLGAGLVLLTFACALAYRRLSAAHVSGGTSAASPRGVEGRESRVEGREPGGTSAASLRGKTGETPT